jgi:hypothetical protein
MTGGAVATNVFVAPVKNSEAAMMSPSSNGLVVAARSRCQPPSAAMITEGLKMVFWLRKTTTNADEDAAGAAVSPPIKVEPEGMGAKSEIHGAKGRGVEGGAAEIIEQLTGSATPINTPLGD